MRTNKEYRKLYRRYVMKDSIKKHRINLWLDRKSERHIQLMAALFIIGFLLTIAYGYKTLATWSQISQIFFALAVVLSFIPNTWLPYIYRVRREMKILLSIAALAPFLTGAVLMINYHFSINEKVLVEKVVNYQYNYSDRIIMVKLENEYINKHMEIRKFTMDKYAYEPDSAAFSIRTGVLGLKTARALYLVPKKR